MTFIGALTYKQLSDHISVLERPLKGSGASSVCWSNDKNFGLGHGRHVSNIIEMGSFREGDDLSEDVWRVTHPSLPIYASSCKHL